MKENLMVILIVFVIIVLLGKVVIVHSFSAIEIPDFWLDHGATQDVSLIDRSLLVSNRYEGGLDPDDLDKPVVIAVHGYTASTFEWRELKETVETESDSLVSLVLLGGHGRSYDAFKQSTWQDWSAPILEEYGRLVALGFRNISIVSASVGGTLVLELLGSKRFDSFSVQPNQLFFVDTFLVPMEKNLRWVPYLRYFLNDLVLKDMPKEDHAYWYAIRPVSTLVELVKLTKRVERLLNTGIKLPAMTGVSLFQSDQDTVVDPDSVEIIYKGLKRGVGDASIATTNELNLIMVSSKHHVYPRLRGRSDVSDHDQKLQRAFYDRVIKLVKEPTKASE